MVTRPRKRRPRGGASLPCPKCGGVTRVLRTSRDASHVVRRRQCARGHVTVSKEAPE